MARLGPVVAVLCLAVAPAAPAAAGGGGGGQQSAAAPALRAAAAVAAGGSDSGGALEASRRLSEETPPTFRFIPPRTHVADIVRCLKKSNTGCGAIRDKDKCLASYDGSNVTKDQFGLHHFGEPCTWCGGQECRSGSASVCAPYDFLMNGVAHGAFASFRSQLDFEVAQCSDEKTRNIAEEDRTCLDWNRLGCNRLTTRDACVSSRDGRNIATLDGFRIAGQACVWCGGVPCTTRDRSLCAPYDWLMGGEGTAYSHFLAKDVYRVATCRDGKAMMVRPWFAPEVLKVPKLKIVTPIPWWRPDHPTPEQSECLRSLGTGCSIIRDKDVCLSSRDGRHAMTHVTKLELYGEPCVWCGGGNCDSSNNNLCGAFNYLMYGETEIPEDPKEFETFHAKQVFQVATCKDGKAIPPQNLSWGGARPLFTPPAEPEPSTLACLHPYLAGCSAIMDQTTCMDSTDGSDIEEDLAGLKVKNQACVWCGGVPCTSNSSSLCEPFNRLMHGEGKAFDVFHSKFNFKVATCEKPANPVPVVQQLEELQCLQSVPDGCGSIRDMQQCLASRDGREHKTLAGLGARGQACVWCGGIACNSGNDTLCEPYDFAVNGLGRAFAASSVSIAWRVGYCKDGRHDVAGLPWIPEKKKTTKLTSKWEHREVLAAAYSQCGGSGWTGSTKCMDGFFCKKQSDVFWQCLPAPAAKPLSDWKGNIPKDGRFIGGGHGDSTVWWQDPLEGRKHKVVESPMCAHCGCNGDPVLMTRKAIADMPEGSPFQCPMKQYAKDHPEGQLLEDTLHVDGVFITADGKEKWFKAPGGVSKHLVLDSGACQECGCSRVELMRQDEFDALTVGPPFTCAMTQPQKSGVQVVTDAGDTDLGASMPSEPEMREAAAGPVASSGVVGLLIGLLAICAVLGLCYWALGGSDGKWPKKRSIWISGDTEEEESEGSEDEEKVVVDREVHIGHPAATCLPGAPAPPAVTRAAAMPVATAAAPTYCAPGYALMSPAAQEYRTVTFTGAGAQAKAFDFAGVAVGSEAQQFRTVTFTGEGAQAKAHAFVGVPANSAPHSGAGSAASLGAAAGSARPFDMFDAIDRNHDGQITREEWQRYAFDAFDRNQDGLVSEHEWTQGRTPTPIRPP